jgi:hypothetical protein
MPEFPPVTIYTLPVKSGRESGWKVISRMKDGRLNETIIEKEEDE